MKTNKMCQLLLVASASAIAMLANPVDAATLYLNQAFSKGSIAPDPSPPWLTITTTANSITFAADLKGKTEFIDEVYLNSSVPIPTGLTAFITDESDPTHPFTFDVSSKPSEFSADGSGRYDIRFTFSNAKESRFVGQQSITFGLKDAFGNDDWNLALSDPPAGSGTFYAAAHVGGTAGGEGSSWIGSDPIGSVPEPSAAALSVLASTLLLIRRRR